MLYGVVLVLHMLVAFFLIGVILIQGGRGGLGETIGGAGSQSLFGGGANTVMTKVTAVAASLFMVSCLFLAKLSTERGRSVIDRLPMAPPDAAAPLPGLPAPATSEGTPVPAPAEVSLPAAQATDGSGPEAPAQ